MKPDQANKTVFVSSRSRLQTAAAVSSLLPPDTEQKPWRGVRSRRDDNRIGAGEFSSW